MSVNACVVCGDDGAVKCGPATIKCEMCCPNRMRLPFNLGPGAKYAIGSNCAHAKRVVGITDLKEAQAHAARLLEAVGDPWLELPDGGSAEFYCHCFQRIDAHMRLGVNSTCPEHRSPLRRIRLGPMAVGE